MGEAKNKGSREDRIKQAQERRSAIAESLGMQRRPVAEIIEELGLPTNSTFHGYAVHIPASDEFLIEYRDQADSTGRKWAKTPDLAKCFPEFSDAYEIARADRSEIVVGVFETETQFFVSEVL